MNTRAFAYYAYNSVVVFILLAMLIFEIPRKGAIETLNINTFLFIVPLLMYILFVLWRTVRFSKTLSVKYFALDWVFIFLYVVFRVIYYLNFSLSGGLSN